MKIYGTVQALNGLVSLEGSYDTYRCGILAKDVYVGSSNLTISSDSGCAGTTTTTTASGGRPHLSG